MKHKHLYKLFIIMATILLLVVLSISFSRVDAIQQPEERIIIGKGIDSSGNMWLIVAECVVCERENVQVEDLNAYWIGDKFP